MRKRGALELERATLITTWWLDVRGWVENWGAEYSFVAKRCRNLGDWAQESRDWERKARKN